jgi:UDP-glucose 4-epimerase
LLKNKKIVITGGAGFIGSNLARSLCEENEVIVIDNLLTGRYENISGIADQIKFVRDDVNNLDMLMSELQSVDYVLHQAALPSVQRSVDDPVTTNRNNIDGMLNVLVAARDCGVKRVVFASSSAIYGDASEMPLRETAPPKPMSPYAVTKLAGEHYCKVFHEVYGLEAVSLRYFNVFGPGQDPSSEYAAVIPKFIKAVKTGGQPVVYGDGGQTRDFVFVADVVRANILACVAPKAAGKAFNIAAGKGISLNQILNTLRIVTSTKNNPIYADPRPGDIRDSVADISLAKEILVYEPEVGVEKGLRAMLSC